MFAGWEMQNSGECILAVAVRVGLVAVFVTVAELVSVGVEVPTV